VQASYLKPLLLKYTRENELNENAKKYFEVIKNWDLNADPGSKGQTVYNTWLNMLDTAIWNDELSKVKPEAPRPEDETLIEALLKDSAFHFIDNVSTSQKETLYDVMTASLNDASGILKNMEDRGKLEWTKSKSPAVYHLLKDAILPFARRDLNIGGDGNIINAVTHSHGPSWRMIVQLTSATEAYGVYPGGESGNPGSKYYDNYVDYWVEGKYYKLWFMKDADRADKNVKWTMKFSSK
jgi:penicillin amidase